MTQICNRALCSLPTVPVGSWVSLCFHSWAWASIKLIYRWCSHSFARYRLRVSSVQMGIKITSDMNIINTESKYISLHLWLHQPLDNLLYREWNLTRKQNESYPVCNEQWYDMLYIWTYNICGFCLAWLGTHNITSIKLLSVCKSAKCGKDKELAFKVFTGSNFEAVKTILDNQFNGYKSEKDEKPWTIDEKKISTVPHARRKWRITTSQTVQNSK